MKVLTNKKGIKLYRFSYLKILFLKNLIEVDFQQFLIEETGFHHVNERNLDLESPFYIDSCTAASMASEVIPVVKYRYLKVFPRKLQMACQINIALLDRVLFGNRE